MWIKLSYFPQGNLSLKKNNKQKQVFTGLRDLQQQNMKKKKEMDILQQFLAAV